MWPHITRGVCREEISAEGKKDALTFWKSCVCEVAGVH